MGNTKRIAVGVGVVGLGLALVLGLADRDALRPVVAGGPAPAFSAFDLEGASRSLADYRGKVLLLNLWATWCTPCKEEMPSIQRLVQEVADEDFLVLAVSIDRAPADDDRGNPLGGRLRRFADSLGLSFTILHDPSGDISTIYRTTGVPESFVVNRQGTIMKKVTGPLAWDAPQNVELVRSLLEEGSVAPHLTGLDPNR